MELAVRLSFVVVRILTVVRLAVDARHKSLVQFICKSLSSES